MDLSNKICMLLSLSYQILTYSVGQVNMPFPPKVMKIMSSKFLVLLDVGFAEDMDCQHLFPV